MSNENPSGFRLDPVTAIGAFTVAAGLTIWKNGGIGSNGLADTLMFVAFIGLMVWLLLPSRDKSRGQQSPNESVSFRFGKALKRILRPHKG